MRMNLPLAVGAAVVAAGLAVLVLWQPEPTTGELAAPAVEFVRARLRDQGKVEGRDVVLDPPVILRRTAENVLVAIDLRSPTGQVVREHHRILRADGSWRHERDLGADFRQFVARETKTICDGLARRLGERYQDAVSIPSENVLLGSRLREVDDPGSAGKRVVGIVEIRYRDGAGEGRWLEEFAFENGTWASQGGTLQDRVPRPR